MTEMDALRVMHITAPSPYGGLEQVVRGLATGHAAAGHDVHVVAIVDAWVDRHPFVEEMRNTAVHLHEVRVARRRYDRERRAVRALIRTTSPDVVHTHGYRTDVLSAPVARRLGVPTVTTIHGFTGGDLKNRMYERIQRWSYRRADAVVAVSALQRDQLARDPRVRDRLHLIRNEWAGPVSEPFDRAASRVALGLPADALVIGWVGRLSREKGPDVLVEALAAMYGADWHAAIVGSGPLEQELREAIRRAGLHERVRLTGPVPDAARYFAAFDVLALTSRTEGLPIVLLEAIASGVPVVATRVGGVPDALDGRGGLLVPPESPAETAAALDKALREPGAARIALAPSPSNDTAGWLEAYESVYRQVAANR